MKKAKIYKPSKTAMQSGNSKFNKWIIEFITEKPGINPLMGWESSTDTYSELILEFNSRELAIDYAKKNKINYEVLEPNIRKVNKKSYADNFTK
ncbi:MAG: ETC complex I subunit [Candidatus Pelagibacter sp.]|tara:strand:- start:60 stop:341 length:282 start_codon:yes stop_codon:yes gene_type:complete